MISLQHFTRWPLSCVVRSGGYPDVDGQPTLFRGSYFPLTTYSLALMSSESILLHRTLTRCHLTFPSCREVRFRHCRQITCRLRSVEDMCTQLQLNESNVIVRISMSRVQYPTQFRASNQSKLFIGTV